MEDGLMMRIDVPRADIKADIRVPENRTAMAVEAPKREGAVMRIRAKKRDEQG